MTTYYVDLVNGNNGNDGLSFANRKKDVSSVTPTAGDTIRLMGSPDPVSMTPTATFTNKSRTITLSSAVTGNITLCESAWTASTNVTCTTSSTRKEGSFSASMAIGASFTTGKAAFFATGTLDLSGYQQISFWVQANVAVSANVLRIRLSTDTTGDTATHDFVINRALNASQWTCLTFDNAANMNSAIASIALVCDSDPGTVTVLLDNIIACKASSNADALNLQSLIGLNTGTDKVWHPIKSINGATVTIDESVNANPTTGRGYTGTGGSGLTVYRRETIKTASVASSSTIVQKPSVAGSSGTPITISGGWNTTDMSTQTLNATITDGLDGFGNGWSAEKAFINWEKIGMVRYSVGIQFTTAGTDNTFTSIICGVCNTFNALAIRGSNNVFTDIQSAACNGSDGITSSTDANNITITTGVACGNATSGFSLNGNNANRWKLGTLTGSNNGSQGLDLVSAAAVLTTAGTFKDNVGAGIRINSQKPCILTNVTCQSNSFGININQASLNNHQVRTFTASSNSTADLGVQTAATHGEMLLTNASMTSTTKVEAINVGRDIRIKSQKEGGDATANKIYSDGAPTGQVIAQSVADSDRHTASGLAWKLTPGSTARDDFYPAFVSCRAFAFNSGSLVTVKAWIKRSSTSLTNRVRIPGGKIAGVDTDLVATGSAAANTYEQVTLSFTPTEKGALELIYEAFGGTTNSAWIDDIEIT